MSQTTSCEGGSFVETGCQVVDVNFEEIGVWPSEISFQIADIGGQALWLMEDPELRSFPFCLTPGTYMFEGYDTYGDGWNGAAVDICPASRHDDSRCYVTNATFTAATSFAFSFTVSLSVDCESCDDNCLTCEGRGDNCTSCTGDRDGTSPLAWNDQTETNYCWDGFCFDHACAVCTGSGKGSCVLCDDANATLVGGQCSPDAESDLGITLLVNFSLGLLLILFPYLARRLGWEAPMSFYRRVFTKLRFWERGRTPAADVDLVGIEIDNANNNANNNASANALAEAERYAARMLAVGTWECTLCLTANTITSPSCCICHAARPADVAPPQPRCVCPLCSAVHEQRPVSGECRECGAVLPVPRAHQRFRVVHPNGALVRSGPNIDADDEVRRLAVGTTGIVVSTRFHGTIERLQIEADDGLRTRGWISTVLRTAQHELLTDVTWEMSFEDDASEGGQTTRTMFRVVIAEGALMRSGPNIDSDNPVTRLALGTEGAVLDQHVYDTINRLRVNVNGFEGWISENLRTSSHERVCQLFEEQVAQDCVPVSAVELQRQHSDNVLKLDSFRMRRENILAARRAKTAQSWRRNIEGTGQVTWRCIDSLPSDDEKTEERQSERKSSKSLEKRQFMRKGWVRRLDASGDESGSIEWVSAEVGYQLGEGSAENPVPNSAAQTDLEAATALPFVPKVQWFRRQLAQLRVPWERGHINLHVHRGSMVHDAFDQMRGLSQHDLRKILRVTFVGEEGIDAGGLQREFFTLASEGLFDANIGLFSYSATDNLTYQINSNSGVANEEHLQYFYFAGRLLAKAILDGQVVKCHLALPLYKHLLGLPISLRDLEFLDREIFTSLEHLMDMPAAEVECLCLDFTVTVESFGEMLVKPLKKNGESIMVTGDNVEEFMALRLRHRMMDSFSEQLRHFLLGFYNVVPQYLLSVFDFQELELLLCGLPELSVDDWKANTDYRGAFASSRENHVVIIWFWETLADFDGEERAKLLQFATGTSRVPVQGFSALQGNDGGLARFTIDSVEVETTIWPRAHTCFNRIDLPLYRSKEELEEYITLAVNMEPVGFHMR